MFIHTLYTLQYYVGVAKGVLPCHFVCRNKKDALSRYVCIYIYTSKQHERKPSISHLMILYVQFPCIIPASPDSKRSLSMTVSSFRFPKFLVMPTCKNSIKSKVNKFTQSFSKRDIGG